jgi:hypothetical protein
VGGMFTINSLIASPSNMLRLVVQHANHVQHCCCLQCSCLLAGTRLLHEFAAPTGAAGPLLSEASRGHLTCHDAAACLQECDCDGRTGPGHSVGPGLSSRHGAAVSNMRD